MLLVHDQVRDKFKTAQDISITLMDRYGLKYENSLQSMLLYLTQYANSPENPDKCHVVIGHDHAEHSFSVTWYFKNTETKRGANYDARTWPILENYHAFMFGGLIFTAPKGYPYEFEECGKHDGWSIHT